MKRLFTSFLDNYTYLILGVCFLITFIFSIGLKDISIQSGFDDSTLTGSNEFIQSIRSVRKSFGDKSKQVIIFVEAGSDSKVTGAQNLHLIKKLSKALKKVNVVRAETVFSFTGNLSATHHNNDSKGRTTSSKIYCSNPGRTEN